MNDTLDFAYQNTELKIIRELMQQLVESHAEVLLDPEQPFMRKSIHGELEAHQRGVPFEPWMSLAVVFDHGAGKPGTFDYTFIAGDSTNPHQIFKLTAWREPDRSIQTDFTVAHNTSDEYSPLEVYTAFVEYVIEVVSGTVEEIQPELPLQPSPKSTKATHLQVIK